MVFVRSIAKTDRNVGRSAITVVRAFLRSVLCENRPSVRQVGVERRWKVLRVRVFWRVGSSAPRARRTLRSSARRVFRRVESVCASCTTIPGKATTRRLSGRRARVAKVLAGVATDGEVSRGTGMGGFRWGRGRVDCCAKAVWASLRKVRKVRKRNDYGVRRQTGCGNHHGVAVRHGGDGAVPVARLDEFPASLTRWRWLAPTASRPRCTSGPPRRSIGGIRVIVAAAGKAAHLG